MVGQFINLIKDSSLVSVVVITDLTKSDGVAKSPPSGVAVVFQDLDIPYVGRKFCLAIVFIFCETIKSGREVITTTFAAC
ncbi:MAG: hypothetical protein BA864_02920 [Desulfuromonadales bacterium C00003093]|nr:MAG: hypothetical protein BA864_02920 [Desulfuromonadales bacterium C00003093]